MSRIACIVFFALLIVPCTSNAETINVQIKGVDDGARTTKQRDYKEAVLFAKREAIERAGVKIKSMTTVKDLVVNSDYIESKAEAVLLPGYNIVDMGYSADGTYQIVLVGKVKTVSEGIDSKELRYAKSLMDRGEKAKAKKIITIIIENSKDDNAVAEATYCQILWEFAAKPKETFEKLKAYYPNSKYTKRAEKVLAERDAKVRRSEAKRRRIEDETGRRIIQNDQRFFHSDEGIMLDTKTGLEWCVVAYRVYFGQAEKSVLGLEVDGGGWRVPSKKELKTIYDKDYKNSNTPLFDEDCRAPSIWIKDKRSSDNAAMFVIFRRKGFELWYTGGIERAYAVAVRKRR